MEENGVMSIKDWLITLVILMIPCVNIVMLFVWAFSSGNENRSNFCKAQLIVMAAIIVLYLLLMLIFGASMFAALGSLANM